jgi:hypothetical protein
MSAVDDAAVVPIPWWPGPALLASQFSVCRAHAVQGGTVSCDGALVLRLPAAVLRAQPPLHSTAGRPGVRLLDRRSGRLPISRGQLSNPRLPGPQPGVHLRYTTIIVSAPGIELSTDRTFCRAMCEPGRRAYDLGMTARITISLPDQLAGEIERAAGAAGQSVSAWLGAAAERRVFADSMVDLHHDDIGPAERSRLRTILAAQQASVAGDDGGAGRRRVA